MLQPETVTARATLIQWTRHMTGSRRHLHPDIFISRCLSSPCITGPKKEHVVTEQDAVPCQVTDDPWLEGRSVPAVVAMVKSGFIELTCVPISPVNLLERTKTYISTDIHRFTNSLQSPCFQFNFSHKSSL